MKNPSLYAETHEHVAFGQGERTAGHYGEFGSTQKRLREAIDGDLQAQFDRFGVVLSRGGRAPSVDILSLCSGKPTQRITLEPGHTPYASDISPNGVFYAYGTRKGRIGAGMFANGPNGCDSSSCCIEVAEPILSVCFLGDSELVASSSEGKLFFFTVGDLGSLLQSHVVSHRTYCALAAVGNAVLVALTTEGEAHFFETPFLHPVRVIPGPRPPVRSALVMLCRWDSAGTLAYAVDGGSLALIELDSGVLRVVPAHRGDFYAIFQIEDRLMTIGYEDRMCHSWHPKEGGKISCCAPRGVLAGVALLDSTHNMVLIDDKGTAAIYEIGDIRLHKREDIEVQDCRAVAGPQLQMYRKARSQWTAAQTEHASVMLLAALERGNNEETAVWHERLLAHGAEPVSLQLQAHYAARNGGFLESLAHLGRLARIAANVERNAEMLLEAGAAFERAWCLRLAAETYSRAYAIVPHSATKERIESLYQTIEAMAEGPFVIDDPGLSLEILIEAASLLGEQCNGRYVLHRLDPIVCSDAVLNSRQVLSKFQMLCEEKEYQHDKTPLDDNVWWIGHQGRIRTSTLVFGSEDGTQVARVELLVRVLHHDRHTVFQPNVAVTMLEKSGHEAPERSNRNVISQIDELRKPQHAVNLWIRDLEILISETIWRLKNEVQCRCQR